MIFFTKHRMFIVKDPLVKLIGIEKFERLKQTRKYRFLTEAFTMNIFSIVITTPNEILIAGMDFGEFIRTRIAAMVFNTLTGRPYGIWRDWLLRRIGLNANSSRVKKYFGDTLAFIGFQLPGYWACCLIGGAEVDEALKASVVLTIIAGLTGGPYGIWLEKFRLECGLSSMGK